MTSGKDSEAAGSAKPVDTGDEDSTNLLKRLADNELLSDRRDDRDEHRGPHRQYGMHDADADSGESKAPANPPTTRGSDG